MSRGVNRDIPAGLSSQAAARLLAAAAAVDAEEAAAAQAIANGDGDEQPVAISEAPIEAEAKSIPKVMKEEIYTQEDSADQDGDMATGASQLKEKSTALRVRRGIRGRKRK